ncbi:hypothetical protein BOTNAR_0506g00030 [Botryotinia narcissicola]|uniref:Uncharacterized protein n=1 Tax=Botryotinia narcissicola TaxID=278944 RepID=A0A4Z1HFH4_9HELO|nr:hypothetical protein BOTNAR_0506g00030 [Botryotinia narcissicola]
MDNTNAADLLYRSQVPPTASQNPDSKIFTSMFDEYTVAPSSQDGSAYLVFPWAAGIYEHLRGNHPKLLEFKGRDPYGYLLSKSSIGPLTLALHAHSPSLPTPSPSRSSTAGHSTRSTRYSTSTRATSCTTSSAPRCSG